MIEVGGALWRPARRARCDAAGVRTASRWVRPARRIAALYIAVRSARDSAPRRHEQSCASSINKNKDEPIFSIADYGIVGDVFEVFAMIKAMSRG